MTSELAFVIGYDISDPRRLLRVHREMCKHATPLEYSIFLPQEDDVRCYALPARGFQGRIGRASMPEGIVWTGAAGGDRLKQPRCGSSAAAPAADTVTRHRAAAKKGSNEAPDEHEAASPARQPAAAG